MKNIPSTQHWYQRVWRWHFYAGLLTLPGILVLAATGMIYLFKPQIDDWQDHPYNHLQTDGPLHSLDDQVAAARAAVSDARVTGVELRTDPTDAARIMMMSGAGQALRVYVRPDRLDILRILPEHERLSMIVRTIHGELLAGEAGAIIVETVGAWAIVLFVTGLYLWWPRNAAGLGGILYPRWGGGRRFLRDLHAVTGFWISVLALFFLLSALPWTKVWGGGLKQVAAYFDGKTVQHDWTTGPASEHADHMHSFAQAAPSGHEATEGMTMPTHLTFDEVARLVRPMHLAAPVLISPPSDRRPNWTVRSDAQDRTERVTLELDPHSGDVVRRQVFADRSLLDRIVGVGVAAHEGQLLGWPNQALGLLTGLGLVTMSVSAALMWWRRRPTGRFGAPSLMTPTRPLAPTIAAIVMILGALLPTFGLSLLLILALERLILRRISPIHGWLGLDGDP